MPIELLAAVEYGGYVSFWKLLFYAAGFWGGCRWSTGFSRIPRRFEPINSLDAVGALAGLLSLVIWLLVPVFFIGLLIYLIVVLGVGSLT
jgi:hypothetical protein